MVTHSLDANVFTLILSRLVPLYLLVLAGYVIGRVLDVRKETVAALLIYFITPCVMFNGVMTTRIGADSLAAPLIFASIACAICLAFRPLTARIWRGPTGNLCSFAAGNANTGYFGLPVVLSLLGEGALGRAVLTSFGLVLYENTLGFYVTARGNYSVRDSLRKVARLPALYAFAAGAFLNWGGVRITGVYEDLFRNLRGAYSVLGMMLIGIGVAGLRVAKGEPVVDWKFIALLFAAKFLVWPAIVLSLISLDIRYWGFFDPELRRVMLILSAVPLAANTVAIASTLRVAPELAAFAVLLSTLFALVSIPTMVLLLP